MISTTKKAFYIAYLLISAIWLGSAFHDSFSTNYTWYNDPMRYINYTSANAIPGALSPWPFSTALLLLSTIIGFILLIKYKGPGRKQAMISITGTFIIIICTLVYFVPTLGKIFGQTNEYDQTSLISMSRTWVILNILRFIILVFLFISGLRGLSKFNESQ